MSDPGPISGDLTALAELETGDQRMQRYREWVTHLLAIAIVGSTIFTALWSFRFVGTDTEMEDAKVLLAAMSGLSGVVIGYYFGRVSGEAHAARAQDQLHQMVGHMGSATTMLEGLEEKVASGGQVEVDDVRRVRRRMSPPYALWIRSLYHCGSRSS